MGIKFLTSFINENLAGSQRTQQLLPAGAKVLVDASGWAFHLQDLCVANGLRQDHLGDYDAFDRVLRAELGKLRMAALEVRLALSYPTSPSPLKLCWG